MTSFSPIFISHGAPDLLLHPTPARKFLAGLGQTLGKPKAILVISAHWHTRTPTISTATKPETIYDFWGFPQELYNLSYPVSGAPDLAQQVSELLIQAKIENQLTPDRGLDHGVWNPLLLMYPQADIPVTQLSIQPYDLPIHHWNIGQALADLGTQGVLILGSGGASHNLWEFGKYALNASPPDWVKAFDQWLSETVEQSRIDSLLTYQNVAPYSQKNHPTPEHFLPLFVALGAAGIRPKGTLLHSSYTYGILSMSAYQFSPK